MYFDVRTITFIYDFVSSIFSQILNQDEVEKFIPAVFNLILVNKHKNFVISLFKTKKKNDQISIEAIGNVIIQISFA